VDCRYGTTSACEGVVRHHNVKCDHQLPATYLVSRKARRPS
jgi:hypothetical protein